MLKFFYAFLVVSIMPFSFADSHVMKSPQEMEWKDGPETLPAGAQISVVAGNPKEKGPFTMRLRFPPKYQIPAHWHSRDENITVIEGVLNMGMGNKLEESAGHMIPTDGFAMMPKKTRHFAFTKEQGAIVQIHGMGPFDITYVDPKDDPRKKK